MKKLFAFLMVLAAALVLVACKKPVDEPKEVTYKLGLGVSVSLEESKKDNAQVDATFATVVLDKDNKIVVCRLDAVQNKMAVANGAVVTDATYQTKMEKGDNYNMKTYAADCNKEWYEQAKFFENYVVGKTAAEVMAIETRVRGNDEPHPGYVVAADETLFAGCSIQIGEFQAAIKKACEDEQGTTFTVKEGTTFTVGTAATSTGAESTAFVPAAGETAAQNAVVKMYSDFAATVVVDGKIAACLTDAIQPQVLVDGTGEIAETKFGGTKRELKEGYNMKKYAADCNIEWYEQAKSFTDYVVGKTKTEVENLPTRVRGNDEPHPGYVVTADETLFASCSIQITGFKAVIAQAINYAR